MREGLVEEMRYPRNPLDVLAQQIVAACAVDEWNVDDLYALVRRCANFSELSEDAFRETLDMLAGRYPSDRFAGLRPRVVWDRVEGRVRAREGAQRVAVQSGGTIPDRGLFGVFLPDGGRVGELDEEMVYESRVGECFVLGASTWRIEEITVDRVVVTPAPGEPAKTPFWKGDRPGRPLELGRALGAVGARAARARPAPRRRPRCWSSGLDARAASNLRMYLDEQAEATGAVPDDRTIVIERFPDEIGDWRVCILTPFGSRVHAPWALAIEERLARADLPGAGAVERRRHHPAAPGVARRHRHRPPPRPIPTRSTSSSSRASRTRRCSRRSSGRTRRGRCCSPAAGPGERTPLWQQRQRAADLLEVASGFPSFPMLLETTRECLRDVFDVPALREVLTEIRSRKIRVVPVETRRASPFAQSLLFGWIAVYMYEGDAPLAERRATALALDRDLLRDLLGAEELRELLDPEALAELELELQRLVPARHARHADDLHDLLVDLGPLSLAEITGPVRGRPAAVARRVAGRTPRDRDRRPPRRGRGRGPPARRARLGDPARVCPRPSPTPVERPLDDLVARYARTHVPFTIEELTARFDIPVERARDALTRLEGEGRVVFGEFRPGGVEREWCDTNVLRILRRRSLAALRHEIEPVDAPTYARFLAAWQGVGRGRRGTDALVEALEQLQGVAIPASVLERDVLPARVDGYRPGMLDELCAAGELVWIGAGPLGADDGRVRLFFRDRVRLLATPAGDRRRARRRDPRRDPRPSRCGRARASGPTSSRRRASPTTRCVLTALWDLVWAGEVTNDTFGPLRVPRRSSAKRSSAARPGRIRAGSRASVRPRARDAGRWSFRCSSPSRPQPNGRTRPRCNCSNGKESSPARPCAPRVRRAASRACTRCCGRLEESGRARRGWFVAGLGAAQFALPGAVDRLRAHRTIDDREPAPRARARGHRSRAAVRRRVVVARAIQRAVGTAVAIGRRIRRARRRRVRRVPRARRQGLVTFAIGEARRRHRAVGRWVEALVEAHKQGRLGRASRSSASTTNRRAPRRSRRALRAAGFADGYKGLTLR